MIPQECFGNVLADYVLYSLGENLIVNANKDLHVLLITSQKTLKYANIKQRLRSTQNALVKYRAEC